MSENVEMSYTRIEYDCSTGIQTTIDLTAEEVSAGKAKLKELGLTDDQIAALVG
jgi:hypothetical protein